MHLELFSSSDKIFSSSACLDVQPFHQFCERRKQQKILFLSFKNPEMLAKHEIMEYNTKNVCRVYKSFSTVYVVDDVVFRIWI
jgi:hypothetical protein